MSQTKLKSYKHFWPALLLINALIVVGCFFHATESQQQFSLLTLSYVPNDDSVAHKLDLYRPANSKGPWPVIVWIHGGAWLLGKKEDTPALGIVNSGYAVASINYRLSDQAIFPAQLDDAKAAVRFLRAHAAEYNLKTDKFGAFGMSAGGHLVALLGTTNGIKDMEGTLGNLDQSSKVQAVCDWCGPTDLMTIAKQGGKKNKLSLDSPGGCVAKLLGGLPKDKPDLAKRASAITFVAADNPPILIMHGDSDDVVPIQQSEEFYKALKAANVKAQFVIVKGAKHNFVTTENLNQAKEFFDRELR